MGVVEGVAVSSGEGLSNVYGAGDRVLPPGKGRKWSWVVRKEQQVSGWDFRPQLPPEKKANNKARPSGFRTNGAGRSVEIVSAIIWGGIAPSRNGVSIDR